MKKIQKKLVVKKKTISQLTTEQMHQVQGGATIVGCQSRIFCKKTDVGCNTLSCQD